MTDVAREAMTDVALEAVLKRLEAGESPRTIVASLRPPGEQELLKRAAVVRTFDQQLFDEVLAPDVGDVAVPSYDELVQSRDVEQLPRTRSVAQVSAAARTANWDAWWPEGAAQTAVPEPLARLATKLADYYRATDRPVDELAQLVLVDPSRALDLFRRLYREADARFDLAACQDLVEVLNDEERTRFIDSALRSELDERVAYLGARSLWSSEYYRTASFVETAGMRKPFEELLVGADFRVLNLHAPGGRGKTMQLNWLIAHQLVPELQDDAEHRLGKGRIPCAKLDFDFVDPVNTTEYPWLVLVEVAAQLSDQLTSRFFDGLLERAGWGLPLLRRNLTDPSRADVASKRIAGEGGTMSEYVEHAFPAILNEALGEAPVVLVLDTLEEVHLRPQGDIRALLELLVETLRQCPGLRLILSGRYSVSEILGEATATLQPMREVEVLPFTEAEAQTYLTERRGLTEAAVCEAIVEKAAASIEGPGCDPFVLSLLADEVQAQRSLSAAEIRKYPAEVIRLINRIVSRIEDPAVCWLLRYGVVPRSLTLAFVRTVMERPLRESMAGSKRLDAPQRDELPRALDGSEEHFPQILPSPDAPLDLVDVWAKLRTYAGSTSWVFQDPGDEQALRFRSDVAIPMRQIVARHPVFRTLHRAAADYFKREAEQDSEHWLRHMREAIYHRFQIEGPAAAAFWRTTLRAAGRRDAEHAAAIAAEVLEIDYVDEVGRPRSWRDDEPIVDPRTLIEAHFERAYALADAARARGATARDQLWSSVENSLAYVEKWEAELGETVVEEPRVAFLRAVLALKDGFVDEAEKRLLLAVGDATGEDRVRLLMLLGDVELARGAATAPGRYEEARRALGRSGRARRAELDLRLVLAYLGVNRLDEANAAYVRALAAPESAPMLGELHLAGAAIGLGSGWFSWADKVAAVAIEHGAGTVAWTQRMRGVRRRLAPLEAQDLANAAATAHPASGLELIGIAAGELMRFDDAFPALERARSAWQSEGEVDGVQRCLTAMALFKLRGLGDIRAAEHHIAEAEALVSASGLSPSSPPSTAWVEVHLTRAELLRHHGAAREATSHMRSTIATLQRAGASPGKVVLAATAALASADASERFALLELLDEQLRLMTPASARLEALRSFKDVPLLVAEDTRDALRLLRSLAHIGSGGRSTAPDRGVLHLIAADIERVSGNLGAALRRLKNTRKALSHGDSSFFLREWWLAADRLGMAPDADIVSRDANAFIDEFEHYPVLCGAFLVERLESAARSDEPRARQLVERAAPFLEGTPGDETQWHVRLAQARKEIARERRVSPADDDRNPPPHRLDPFSELDAGGASIRLTLGREGVEVEAHVPHAGVVHADPSTRTLRSRLAEWTTAVGRPSSYGLEDRWASDLASAEIELGKLLYPRRTADHLRGIAVRLEIEDPRLCLLPWELARTGAVPTIAAGELGLAGITRAISGDDVRRDATIFVQTALAKLSSSLPIDGVFGPATIDLLRRYQQQRGDAPTAILNDALLGSMQRELAASTIGPPLVILARAAERSQLVKRRGSLSLGIDTQRLYRAHGFDVWTIEDPSLHEIRRAVAQALETGRAPAVLHLSGSLHQAGSAVAFSFLAGAWYSEALAVNRLSDELTVTAVDDVLRLFPLTSFRPLVVLDVDRPPAMSETIAQLFLRNQFAGDLFALGRCPALLATGLVDERSGEMYHLLLDALAAGMSVAGAHRQMTHVPAPRDSHDFDAAAATALFTHLPWLRLTYR